ncbi:mitochondrial processing peptidase beta subunit [Basidiobolus meristosporus CBS 931.73]|uniref:mitochondrial processing peptidase n=1 Tax=Basidiobolus meristosporus CBS 931.73 TaxID=1314790 RepID=A0A1Y1XVY1_9FUNG|nr:mitochondrial processing peptidase beta subunit [Basidiobolus meristosporus CBS 931.73]|eukprot:ORX89919.1 mitochondrial processing peptidase beta subunit [Basidiobolus meristosporus CBS 931.73]
MTSRVLLPKALKPLIPFAPTLKATRTLPILHQRFGTVTEAPRTRISKLANGFTVATESIPTAKTATVGVWIDAGSRAENSKNNGTAHFLEHMAFKGTKRRTQRELEVMIENMGGHLNAYTSREQTVYYAKTFKSDLPAAVDILSDILLNSTLNPGAVERERDVIVREQEEVDKIMEEVVFDHLHATAFQEHSLGRTILGPKENILSIKRDDLVNYITTNYKADRMVLVGAGGVDHEELVSLAEKHFSLLPSSDGPRPESKRPKFVGSEIKLTDNTASQAHIALAVEGVGWSSPDYYPMLILQSIIGNWDRAFSTPSGSSFRLSSVVAAKQLANSFMSFNTSYSDTGLFGIYMISENKDKLDELVFTAQKEWARLSVTVTDAEVERAKQQLKAALLLNLDGSTAIAEDIGRQMITMSKRVEPKEVEATINSITGDDVRRIAQQYLYDRDIAVVGLGPVDKLPEYSQIRIN